MSQTSSVAWAAGLFEGEGSFTITLGGGNQCTMVASLAMVDEDVVRRFHAVVGVGSVTSSQFTKRGKQVFRWAAVGKAVLELVDGFAPYLGERRLAQAEAMMLTRRLYEEGHPRCEQLIQTRHKENQPQ